MTYCTPTDVGDELGVTLTPDQAAHADDLIAAAQDWIDRYTGRTFEASVAIVDERHVLYGTELYLDRAPIASVTTVKVRPAYVGATSTTLVVATEYVALDLTRGIIRLAYDYGDGYEILVTYTPAITVPARVKRATTLLVAGWMAPGVSGMPAGVKQFSVAGELSVTFADGTTGGIPDAVKALLGAPKVIFA